MLKLLLTLLSRGGVAGGYIYVAFLISSPTPPPKKKKKKFNWAGLWPNTLHAARCHGLIWA